MNTVRGLFFCFDPIKLILFIKIKLGIIKEESISITLHANTDIKTGYINRKP